ncbi:MAG: hypothetical protein EBV06_15320 [Planctomycetia bacterium]|nr:hypothetical protein [Planctomycetia bacterium]
MSRTDLNMAENLPWKIIRDYFVQKVGRPTAGAKPPSIKYFVTLSAIFTFFQFSRTKKYEIFFVITLFWTSGESIPALMSLLSLYVCSHEGELR